MASHDLLPAAQEENHMETYRLGWLRQIELLLEPGGPINKMGRPVASAEELSDAITGLKGVLTPEQARQLEEMRATAAFSSPTKRDIGVTQEWS